MTVWLCGSSCGAQSRGSPPPPAARGAQRGSVRPHRPGRRPDQRRRAACVRRALGLAAAACVLTWLGRGAPHTSVRQAEQQAWQPGDRSGVERGEEDCVEVSVQLEPALGAQPLRIRRGGWSWREREVHCRAVAGLQSLRRVEEQAAAAARLDQRARRSAVVPSADAGDLHAVWGALSTAAAQRRKERKKTDNPREGWEDGTPPPHRDFKERGVMR